VLKRISGSKKEGVNGQCRKLRVHNKGLHNLYISSNTSVPGALSLELKRPGREADYLPTSSVEVKE
jgi:hypothetical protein